MNVMLKIAEAAEKVISRNLALIESGTAPCIPQDHSKATCFGGRKPEDGRIDWNSSARDICNLVRAVTRPYPGAFTDIDGERVFIWKAVPLEDDTRRPPGTVISRDPLVISAGKGSVRVEEKNETRES
jgi:methionyl-tRNA formyltransferase